MPHLTAILTAVYLFNVAMPMYFRPLNEDHAQLLGQKKDPSWMMLLPFGVLCVSVILLGMYAQPLVNFLRQTAAGLM